MRTRTVGVLVVVLSVAAGCGSRTVRHAPPGPTGGATSSTVTFIPSTTAPATTAKPAAHPVPVKTAGAALTPFSSCPQFLAAVRTEAAQEVQPWGLQQGMGAGGPAFGGAGVASGAAGSSGAGGATAPAAPSADATSSAGGFSTTNNQEVGVDEPDLAKTDGRLLVTLHAGTRLQVVDVSGTKPDLDGSLSLPQTGQVSGLFLVGSDVVVLATSWSPAPASPSGPAAVTEVWVVSVADPDHPALVRTFTVDGNEVAARLIGRRVTIVVSGQPRLAFPPPSSSTPDAGAQAIATNRAVINRAPLEDWLPAVTDAAGHRHVADCALVSHASEPAGVGTVSVVSIDPDQAQPGPAVTILGDAGTVYASATDLYVAASSFAVQQAAAAGQVLPGETALVHDFDLTNPAGAVYRGSGAVPGVILNQYALSEYAGNLRVATTLGTPAPPPGEGGPVPAGAGSQSLVTVLHAQAGALATVGQVGGLGQGQRIYGVRFVGPLGYVVTFRQLDPLYVVDLSDPAHPAVRGALELSGYSAYLHPVGPGLLLGIGAAADNQAHRTGAQVSLFDVSAPARPRLVGQDIIDNGQASIENDTHAFLWWAPAELAVIPVQTWGQTPWTGAVVLRVDPTHGLTEVGRLSHEPPRPPQSPRPSGGSGPAGPAAGAAMSPAPSPGAAIQRALVVGNDLYTISDAGVLASDLGTLGQVSWLTYPA